jgi:hypothetical protein
LKPYTSVDDPRFKACAGEVHVHNRLHQYKYWLEEGYLSEWEATVKQCDGLKANEKKKLMLSSKNN